jgi:hypothetical protein
MLWLQKGSCVVMYRRLTQTFENETAFTVGVICLGLSPVALVLAAFFVE